MRMLPIDLKLRLGLRVSALAALCFVAALAYTLFETHREARLQRRSKPLRARPAFRHAVRWSKSPAFARIAVNDKRLQID